MVPHHRGHQLLPFHRWKQQVLHHVLWRTCKFWGWATKTHPKLLVTTRILSTRKQPMLETSGAQVCKQMGVEARSHLCRAAFLWSARCLTCLTSAGPSSALPFSLLCYCCVLFPCSRSEYTSLGCLVVPQKCPPDPGIVLPLLIKPEIHTLLDK